MPYDLSFYLNILNLAQEIFEAEVSIVAGGSRLRDSPLGSFPRVAGGVGNRKVASLPTAVRLDIQFYIIEKLLRLLRQSHDDRLHLTTYVVRMSGH